MNRKTFPGRRFKMFTNATQASVEKIGVYANMDQTFMTICEVTSVHPDRMTVDIFTSNAVDIKNVPLMARAGLESEEVWGEMEVPSVGTFLLVAFVGGSEGTPVALGAIFPYTNPKYQSNQTPANSGSKAFTLKLLEDVDRKVYRRIFKSGTSFEVKEDGTLTIETPSGRYIQIDETGGTLKLSDPDGNVIELASAGTTITDANGNTITMDATKVSINGNLEVLQ